MCFFVIMSNFQAMNCFKVSPFQYLILPQYLFIKAIKVSKHNKVPKGTILELFNAFLIFICHALQRMTDKCFKKCIGKPGSTLDNSEQVEASLPFTAIHVTLRK